jgi:DNA-binding response OmpR family regulator
MTKKILAVDDERDFLGFISQVIQDYCPGYHVQGLDSGAEALATAKKSHPDLILLDVYMPGVDGYEVCRRLKADPETASIPVIMISGVLTDPEHRVRGLDTGAEGYICKPFHPAELVAQIRALLRVRDEIKQRQRTEDEFRWQKIEAIGLLAAGIAHDFNNMLTAIIGNISFVRTCECSRKDMLEALREAEEAALRAKDLSQQLLTFSRGGQPVRSVVAVGPLLTPLVERGIRAHGVPVHLEVPANLPPALADPTQLGTVMENVLDNAREAVEGGGSVRIRAEAFALGDEPPPPDTHLKKGLYIHLEVRDSGAGIPPEDMPHIFQPFFTTKPTRRGLGLSTAYSILRQHDGALAVSSEPGKGTAVHIYLPAVVETSAVSAPFLQTAKTGPMRRKRILVMDDEAAIRRLLVRGLTLHGYEVDSAADGEMAVDLFQRSLLENRPYDLAILDLTVPCGMGGAETVRKLRELQPSVRAVVSSGYSEDPVMSHYLEYGFDGVARKPYNLPDLLAIVEKTIAGSPPH